jgi:hypothetical protein
MDKESYLWCLKNMSAAARVHAAEGTAVKDVYFDDWDEAMTLAAAAPELLAALIDCKDALAGHVAYDDTDSAECEAYHAARAAIARAKGGGE